MKKYLIALPLLIAGCTKQESLPHPRYEILTVADRITVQNDVLTERTHIIKLDTLTGATWKLSAGTNGTSWMLIQ
jgi:hypothetical protein